MSVWNELPMLWMVITFAARLAYHGRAQSYIPRLKGSLQPRNKLQTTSSGLAGCQIADLG
jgi:hypothetical protein